MSTRQADAEALVRRAERAGWLVSRSKAGWKVQTPQGPYPIHMTYSDIRSLTNATKALERMGLTKAEANMATVRQTAKVTKLNELRQVEEARTAALVAAEKENQRSMLARAAGPYMTEPEDVGAAWFATPHPQPWARWVRVTPEIARFLLENYNTDNRRLREKTVEHYRNIILSGQWHLTHQGVAMDVRPMLQDGQHRLQAIVQAGEQLPGLAVPMLFCVGMPEENFKAIDEGLLRSAADLFGRGDNAESYGSTIGTCIRLVMAFNSQNPRRLIRQKYTNEAIFDAFEQDPDELRIAARFGVTNYKKAYSTAGPMAAAHYLLRNVNGPDNKYVAAFLEGLITGRRAGTRIVLDETDPRQVVREHFQQLKLKQKRITPIETLCIIVLAWNDIVSGRQPRFVRFNDESAVPRVLICKDSGPDASATPALLQGEVDEY
jgi:hypothetical protein